jgi:hypothetical protein
MKMLPRITRSFMRILNIHYLELGISEVKLFNSLKIVSLRESVDVDGIKEYLD